MNGNDDIHNQNINNEKGANGKADIDNGKQQYTFVRETIKKKPPLFFRILLRLLHILGLGIVFGLGLCLVLFVFDKDFKTLFMDKEEETTNKELETTTKEDLSNQGTMSLDETINLKLVNVSVMFYIKDETTIPNMQDTIEVTDVYTEEGVTASVSDNKEVQLSTDKDKETATEKNTTEIEETVADNELTDEMELSEKRNYTGVIISKTSKIFILISYEKIKGSDRIYVLLEDEKQIQAELYANDTATGMAIITIPSKDISDDVYKKITSASILEIDSVNSGDKLVYAGNPNQTGRLLYSGTLAGTDKGNMNYDIYYRGIITDISNNNITDGFLFDENGMLVGIVKKLYEDDKVGNMITGISASDLSVVIKALINKERIRHIGIKGEKVTDEMRELTGEKIPDGMYVTDVARDSTAYTSGIMIGDIIVQINNKQVENLGTIQNVLANSNEGGTVTIVLKRKIGTSYNEFTIKVPVEAY